MQMERRTNNKQFRRIELNWIESNRNYHGIESNRIELFSSLPNRPALVQSDTVLVLAVLDSSSGNKRLQASILTAFIHKSQQCLFVLCFTVSVRLLTSLITYAADGSAVHCALHFVLLIASSSYIVTLLICMASLMHTCGCLWCLDSSINY